MQLYSVSLNSSVKTIFVNKICTMMRRDILISPFSVLEQGLTRLPPSFFRNETLTFALDYTDGFRASGWVSLCSFYFQISPVLGDFRYNGSRTALSRQSSKP